MAYSIEADYEITHHNFRYDIKRLKVDLTNVSGVYVYHYRGHVLYVGASKNLFKRALRCYTGRDTFSPMLIEFLNKIGWENTKVRIYKCSIEQLPDWETFYTRTLNPVSQIFDQIKPYRPFGKCNQLKTT